MAVRHLPGRISTLTAAQLGRPLQPQLKRKSMDPTQALKTYIGDLVWSNAILSAQLNQTKQETTLTHLQLT